MTDICCRCGVECDGSLMRTNPKYTRVRDMITHSSVPRLPNGGIALCHLCQRAVYFANGFLLLLTQDLSRAAQSKMVSSRKTVCPRCGHDKFYVLKSRKKMICKNCARHFSKKSIGDHRCSKLSDEKKMALLEAFKTMTINQAAAACGVQYKTAWRLKKMTTQ